MEEQQPEQPATDAESQYEIIPLPEEINDDPFKPGHKPKKLVALEVKGFEIGQGLRKRIVNPDDVYKLAALGCTTSEIARWFDVSNTTLNHNFATIIEKGREDLKHSLRRAMLKNAMSGNAALQIFLAKNLLGMSDNPHTSEDNKILPWNDN
jgi:hypothetical protein